MFFPRVNSCDRSDVWIPNVKFKKTSNQRYLLPLLDGALELDRLWDGDDPFESNLRRFCSVQTNVNV